MSIKSSQTDDVRYMKMALDEASRAYAEGEVPVGAIVVCKGRVITRTHNLTEMLTDVTAHAEMQAGTAAANYLGGKYLTDWSMALLMRSVATAVLHLKHCIQRRRSFRGCWKMNASNL